MRSNSPFLRGLAADAGDDATVFATRLIPQELTWIPLIAAVVIGTMEWLLLRHRLPIGPRWVVVSAAKMVVPVTATFVPALREYAGYFWMLALIAIG